MVPLYTLAIDLLGKVFYTLSKYHVKNITLIQIKFKKLQSLEVDGVVSNVLQGFMNSE